MIGFGIESKFFGTGHSWAEKAIAEYFQDDYPYFEAQQIDPAVQKERDKIYARAYNDLMRAFSILELLKLASFADIMHAIDG